MGKKMVGIEIKNTGAVFCICIILEKINYPLLGKNEIVKNTKNIKKP